MLPLHILPFKYSLFLSACQISVVWSPVETAGGEEGTVQVPEKRSHEQTAVHSHGTQAFQSIWPFSWATGTRYTHNGAQILRIISYPIHYFPFFISGNTGQGNLRNLPKATEQLSWMCNSRLRANPAFWPPGSVSLAGATWSCVEPAVQWCQQPVQKWNTQSTSLFYLPTSKQLVDSPESIKWANFFFFN